MTGARAGQLMRAAVSGAADLPDIELELGPITALVGAPPIRQVTAAGLAPG